MTTRACVVSDDLDTVHRVKDRVSGLKQVVELTRYPDRFTVLVCRQLPSDNVDSLTGQLLPNERGPSALSFKRRRPQEDP